MYKPERYNSVSPYFIVSDAIRWIELLNSIFSVEELRRYEHPNGMIMHAELMLDDSVIMLSQATDKHPVNQLFIHVYVSNAVESYDRAIELGCESLEEPEKKDDPDIRGMFKDFSGHIWSVGTMLGEI